MVEEPMGMTWRERIVWGLLAVVTIAVCVGIGVGSDWLRIRLACGLGWLTCK